MMGWNSSGERTAFFDGEAQRVPVRGSLDGHGPDHLDHQVGILGKDLDLLLGQQSGLPRRTGRQGAEKWRCGESGHHRDQGRLAW